MLICLTIRLKAIGRNNQVDATYKKHQAQSGREKLN
jgi:hypothetical protein